jgi:SH3 domain-containing YSC84-like protein 1
MKTLQQCAMVMIGILAIAPVTFARDHGRAKKQDDRIANSSAVMAEILNVPDKIPRDLLDKARCVVIVPSVVKAAFIVGADYGRGTMVCRTGRDFSGAWGAPAMYALEGGSLGFQIGGEATDFVFLIMNDRGANSLLHSKVKLGADASIAAGPVGRSAAADTDAYMRSEILSYSRARGVFAGISLEGSTLRPDDRANSDLYGRSVTAAQIVMESEVQAPSTASGLIVQLQTASPRLKS